MVLTGPSDPDMSQQNALAFWAVVPGVNHKAEEVESSSFVQYLPHPDVDSLFLRKALTH